MHFEDTPDGVAKATLACAVTGFYGGVSPLHNNILDFSF